MRLIKTLEIKSRQKIEQILSEEHVGRMATIDGDGYPQIIPMNFVFLDGMVYMHSHTRGEKLDNVARSGLAGFETDREVEFLPSYFFDPADASLADTLYYSVVIKGRISMVSDQEEKVRALNALMSKYQPEGGYEPLIPGMKVLDHVAVIRIRPDTMRGKYKLGQDMDEKKGEDLASKIMRRGTQTARATIGLMGFEEVDGRMRMIKRPDW